MNRKQEGWRAFLLAFGMGLVLLALPFAWVLVGYARELEAPAVSLPPPAPDADTAMTLLLAGTLTGEAPDGFWLLRAEPATGRIAVAALPPDLSVEHGGRLESLAAVYQKEGGERAAAQLSSSFSIGCDRYLALDAEGLRGVVDSVGTMEFTLPAPILLADGTQALPAGRQLLDGRRMLLLLTHDGDPGGESERLGRWGELLAEFLSQRVPLLDEGHWSGLFETAVTLGRSNLTIGDFAARQRALGFLSAHPISMQRVTLSGEFSVVGKGFLPDAAMLQQLQVHFPKSK